MPDASTEAIMLELKQVRVDIAASRDETAAARSETAEFRVAMIGTIKEPGGHLGELHALSAAIKEKDGVLDKQKAQDTRNEAQGLEIASLKQKITLSLAYGRTTFFMFAAAVLKSIFAK